MNDLEIEKAQVRLFKYALMSPVANSLQVSLPEGIDPIYDYPLKPGELGLLAHASDEEYLEAKLSIFKARANSSPRFLKEKEFLNDIMENKRQENKVFVENLIAGPKRQSSLAQYFAKIK